MTDLPMMPTVHEVAAWLGWTEGKLRNRIQRGEGHPPFVRNGRSIEFRRDDVLAWYASLPTVQPAANEPKMSKRRQSSARKAVWPDQRSA